MCHDIFCYDLHNILKHIDYLGLVHLAISIICQLLKQQLKHKRPCKLLN